MGNDLRPIDSQVANRPKIEDQIRVAFAPAKPTEKALEQLRPAFDWFVERERDDREHLRMFFDLGNYWPSQFIDRARARVAVVPDASMIENAQQLFHDAEHVPAPWGWYALAFNAMLASAPNAKSVAPAYTFAIIDSLQHDDEICQGYRPGFSPPVVVRAIRQLRRESNFVPTPAEIFRACQQHRVWFRERQRITGMLLQIRHNAEQVIAEFEEDERQTARSTWRPPPMRPDEEPLPF